MPEVEKNQRFVVVCRLIKSSIELEDTVPLKLPRTRTDLALTLGVLEVGESVRHVLEVHEQIAVLQ